MRSVAASRQSPEASQIGNGKWQIKCEMQMPEASQGAINLLTEQILKGGVPLFEEGKEHDRRRWRKQGV